MNKIEKFIGAYITSSSKDDHLIALDNNPDSLCKAANLSPILSFTMVVYTNTEYAHLVLMYGEAAGNGRAARRIYQERYQHRVTPSLYPVLQSHSMAPGKR